MSALPQLRKLINQLVTTPSDLEAFLLDYFKEEVYERCNPQAVDRTGVINVLLQRASAEQIIAALEDWTERNNQPFSLPAELAEAYESGRRDGRLRPGRAARKNWFLDRVLTACELRERKHSGKGLVIHRVTPRGTLCVFHVSYFEDGFPTSYALCATEQPLHTETIGALCEILKQRQLPSGYSLPTVLIYTGEKPSQELTAQAQQQKIKLRSIDEYEHLLDNLPEAVALQTKRLQKSDQYLSELYVPQVGELSSGSSFRFDTPIEPVWERLIEMLRSDEAQFILILGEFGLGKTFLMYELVRELSKGGEAPWPVLCELRHIEKKQNLDSLFAWQLQESGIQPIDPAALRHLVRLGKIVLFFDGFDELALRTTYDRATEHLDTLLKAVEGSAKVVLTSRTQHFQNDRQLKTALAERLERVPSRVVRLLKFAPWQIRRYLRKRLGAEPAVQRYNLIQEVHDLLGLSENPRMLGFIAGLPEARLLAVKEQKGHISAAELYRLILDEWLQFEVQRVQQAGLSLSSSQLLLATTQLAHVLWRRTERSATLNELASGAQAALATVSLARVGGSAPPSPEEAMHQVGAASLLVRDAEGRFSFLHQSVLEWLVASDAAAQLRQNCEDHVLDQAEMSPLMAEFFIDLLGKENSSGEQRAVGWVTSRLDADSVAPGAEWSKRNALRVAERLKTAVPVLQARKLAGQDLRSENFAGRTLNFSDLSGAQLQGVSLAGAKLRHANLRGAQLMGADLRGADLREADLSAADLSRAQLMRADLRGAKLQDAVLQRAKLLNCRLDGGALPMLLNPRWLGTAAPDNNELQHSTARSMDLFLSSCCYSVSWEAGLLATMMGGDVGLWDLASGQLIRLISGHESRVWSVALSVDGKTLASGSADNTVRLWDPATGLQRHVLSGHRGSVWSVALSIDGKTLASGSADNTIRLWDPATGRQRHVLSGHGGSVLSVAVSVDGNTLASGSDDNTVRLWDSDTGRQRRVLSGHEGSVWSVALSVDGKTLASGSDDNTVRLWDPATGRQRHVLSGHGGSVWSVALSVDGRTLASGSADNTVRLWDPDTGRQRHVLSGHGDSVWSVALSVDGKTLASGSDDKTVRLWDPDTGLQRHVLSGHRGSVWSVALSADGKTLASGSADKTVRLWDPATGRQRHVLSGHGGGVLSVALSVDSKTLASGSEDKTVRLWDPDTGLQRHILSGHGGGVWSVALSVDGKTLASGSADNTIRLWDPATGRQRHVLSGHGGIVWSMALSVDGKTLASGSDDKTVRLWDPATGLQRHVLSGHSGGVWSVALSVDGKTLASGSADKTIRLWDSDTGRQRRLLSGHGGIVLSVALSVDGKTLASGSEDRTVRLWDPSTGRQRHVLSGHGGGVWSVALSADGKTLASGSEDNTVRLWDVDTGCCLAILIAGPSGWVCFSPDGRYKSGGNPRELAWHAIQLCRYELATANPDGSSAEPGELDDLLPGLRLAPEQPLRHLAAWSPPAALASHSSPPAASSVDDPPTRSRQPSPTKTRRASSTRNTRTKRGSPTTQQQGQVPGRAAESHPSDQLLFSWLHLSDLHFGHGDAEHGWDQQLVLSALRSDVLAQVRGTRVPAPNALLVTGDIAFSGAVRRPTEYQEAGDYLTSLTAELQITAPAVFLVPGNHDVQRTADQDRNLRRLLRDLRAGEETLDEVLANADDTALLQRRQANYWAFARSFGPPASDPRFHTRHSLVHKKLKVRLLGLNTALLAADDQDHGRLRLGKGALSQLLAAPAPAPDELVMALSHHPLGSGWLADEKEAEAWLRRHAHIHLSGHVHEASSEHLRRGSGGELVRVTAGAAHGDKAPKGVPNSHGYNIAAVVYTAEGDLVLRIWPRRFSDSNKDFRVDVDNVSPDQPYAEHLLRLPWQPAGG